MIYGCFMVAVRAALLSGPTLVADRLPDTDTKLARAWRGVRHLVVMLLLSLPVPAGAAEDLRIFGWIENVQIGAGETRLPVKAKLDSGARSSSLHALKIERFDRDAQPWVRFTMAWTDNKGDYDIEPVVFERPWVDDVRIKRRKGEAQRRPVVEMEICLGGQHRTIRVNLVNRSKFLYPLLLGRRTLAGWGLIDPQRTYLHSDACGAA